MKPLLKLMTLALAVIVATGAYAAEFATKDEAKAMAEKAAKYAETNGLEAAKKAFTAPSKEFVDRDLYVFMYSPEGTVLAHGTKPQWVGMNRKDTPDADGKLYVHDMIATKVGTPQWINYMFMNPANKKVEPKSSYIIHLAKPDVLIGVGAYDIK